MDPSVSAIQTSPNGGDSPQAQIANAFTAWNTANAGPGGDGTQFLPATASNPATVTVTADPSYTGNQGAYSTTPSPGIINSLNPATITLYPNGTLPGGTPAFQSQAAGYNTAYWQVMVHEIGHIMGFGDYPPGQAPPPGPNASAINPLTGVNGTGQTPPTLAPTGCDTSTAATYASNITYTPLPSAPTGSGGGGGGTPKPPISSAPTAGCDEEDYWDPDTNTLTTYCW